MADLVDGALDEPDVQAALATYVTDLVSDAVGLEDRLSSLLPGPLDRFGATVANAADAALDRLMNNLLSNPAVRETIDTIVQRAHSRAVWLLQGDGLADGISVVDGAVTIDLLPLISASSRSSRSGCCRAPTSPS